MAENNQHTLTDDNDKKDKDNKNELDQTIEEILKEEDVELLIEELEDNPEIKEQIDELLSSIDAGELTEIQSRLLLLLQKFSGKLRDKFKEKEKFEELFKSPDGKLQKTLRELSMYLMSQNVVLKRSMSKNAKKGKDKLESMSKKMLQKFKKMVKKFAVYEIYKAMNPNRIAGETHKENFVSNYIVGGMKRAEKYKSKDVNISKNKMKQLAKAHKKYKQTGMGMSM